MTLQGISHPTVARLMLPDDANPGGNVHGGTILQLMEQAGLIQATRHCNSEPGEHQGNLMAGLVRFETMSFHLPMHVGELASVTADVVFTSNRSMLVKVVVTAEGVKQRKPRITNSGLLWYAAFVLPKGDVRAEISPQIKPPECEKKLKEYNLAKQMYEKRKSSVGIANIETNEECTDICFQNDGCLCPKCREKYVPPEGARTPSSSIQRLCQVVLPGDCGLGKVAFGGFVMKIMDNAAGCCAFRHALSNIVTVSISSLDFTNFVFLGDVVTIDAKMLFVSSKSMEISVKATTSSMKKENVEVAKGVYTFVSLGKDRKCIPVPGLAYETEEEYSQAYEAQVKYENDKRERISKRK